MTYRIDYCNNNFFYASYRHMPYFSAFWGVIDIMRLPENIGRKLKFYTMFLDIGTVLLLVPFKTIYYHRIYLHKTA